MYLLFMTFFVFGVTILACQTSLSILGIGDASRFLQPSDDSDVDAIDINYGDLGDGRSWRDSIDDTSKQQVDDKSTRLGSGRVRAVGMAITFFGLTGAAAESCQFTMFQTMTSAIVAALIAYLGAESLKSVSVTPYAARLDQGESEAGQAPCESHRLD